MTDRLAYFAYDLTGWIEDTAARVLAWLVRVGVWEVEE
jgi:hypothetical protein